MPTVRSEACKACGAYLQRVVGSVEPMGHARGARGACWCLRHRRRPWTWLSISLVDSILDLRTVIHDVFSDGLCLEHERNGVGGDRTIKLGGRNFWIFFG